MTSLLERFAVATPAGPLGAVRAHPRAGSRGIALFVTGFTGSSDDFRFLLTDAAAQGWDAVAVSLRGQRGSVAPVGIENYTLSAYASEVARVASSIGGGRLVHLVGHSLGGLVAREAVVRQPDSFASLTMLCSGPGGRRDSHRDDARLAATSDPALIGGARILQTAPDTTDAVVATHVPVLVAHGDADDAWPIADQYDMAVRLGAEYRVVPGAGHSPNIDNPGVTARFLSEFWAAF
jgi:pimeloyl-ACP methyl ester carboxylesterase